MSGFALPPLLVKGYLKAPTEDPVLQSELDKWVPLEYILNWFRVRLQKTGVENRILVVKSKTASGKSSTIPARVFLDLVDGKDRAGVICTQPRVVTTINVTKDIVFRNPKLKLGQNIGWMTKHNKLRPEKVSLLLATVGTLAQQLKTFTDEEIMETYRYVLIDETHERDIQTDLTIYMLKNFLVRNSSNPRCPFVVLMSATFDPQPFLTYFGVDYTNYIQCEGAKQAPRTEIWDWNDNKVLPDYMKGAADVVELIVRDEPDGRQDILIFLPGGKEMEETAALLKKLNERLVSGAVSDTDGIKGHPFTITKLESETINKESMDYQLAINIPIEKHPPFISQAGTAHPVTRRVIMSTNVAETGLTLNNLKYVIDSGYDRVTEYNPILGIGGLLTKPATKSGIIQRMGRAGRTSPGVFYPLYPKYIYDMLTEQKLPKILTEDISASFVDILKEQQRSKKTPDSTFVIDIDMIDPPSQDAIQKIVEKLYLLGYIAPVDAHRLQFTPLGELLTNFTGIPPDALRMAVAAFSWGVYPTDMITIAAYIAEDHGYKLDPKLAIDWNLIYKTGMPKKVVEVSKDQLLHKMKLLLADDYIDGLVLYLAVMRVLVGDDAELQTTNTTTDAKTTPTNHYLRLKKWCITANISFSTVMYFLKRRDEYLEQFLLSKFDIFRNRINSFVELTPVRFMDYVVRMKHCIYDGYRQNILVLQNDNYVMLSTNLPVKKPKLFMETAEQLAEAKKYGSFTNILPSVLCYSSVGFKADAKGDYKINVSYVSTMDGFVSIDREFNI